MPRKPHVRPRVAIRALDRAWPNDTRMLIFNPHGSGPPDHTSRMIEVTLTGCTDGSLLIRLDNLADPEQGQRFSVEKGERGGWVLIQIPPAP